MKHLWLCYSLSCSHTSTLSWRCGICNFSYLYFYCNLYYRPVFSWESKPKLVKSHPSDQSEHKPMRTQSENMSNKLPELQKKEDKTSFLDQSKYKVQSWITSVTLLKIALLKQDGVFCTMKFSLRLNIYWTLMLSFSLSCMWSVDCLLRSLINNGLVHVLN